MPSHPDRVRSAPLPVGYQFGDAGTSTLALPRKQIIAGRPNHLLVVEVLSATDALISAGIRELARAAAEGTFSAYARLEMPIGVEDVRHYGPIRFHTAFSMFPADGSEPRMRSFLTIGFVGWRKPELSAMSPPVSGPGAPWRRPSDTAAEQLARRGDWNVIEGEHFDSDAERHPVIEGARSDA